MADATTYVATYLRAIEAFNRGDMPSFGELMTEACVFQGFGDNRTDILKTIQQGRDDGWLSHNAIAIATAGDFLVALYENRFGDGTGVIGSGILRFNEDGVVREIVGRGPIEGQAGSTDAASHVGKWQHIVEAFNQGDLVGFGAAMAEECTWEGVGGKTETLAALQQARDDGWLSHNTIGAAGAGEFLITVYQNRFADGRTVIGAGIGQVGATGLFTEFVSREPGPVGTIVASQ